MAFAWRENDWWPVRGKDRIKRDVLKFGQKRKSDGGLAERLDAML